MGTIGIFLFVVSMTLSLISFFLWKKYQRVYLPIIINLATIAFLSLFWMATPTDISNVNGYRSMFYYHTNIELPNKISDLKEYDSGPSFLGDGDAELSFRMTGSDLRDWMARSGFSWKEGPYQKKGSPLNQFNDESRLFFVDSSDVQYATVNRTPADVQERGYLTNYTNIFANQKEGWILIVDYDS